MQPETGRNVFSCIPAIRKRRNTGHHTATADHENRHQRQTAGKHINHTELIGNQPDSRTGRRLQIMTGWWHQTRIVIISRQFQNPVQRIFRSWRNRKRGTLYARTRKAPNQQKRPDDHGKRPDRNSFQKSATILIFYGRGFSNRWLSGF